MDGWLLEDLGSANGTLVADARISGTRAVEPGVAIVVGDFLLKIVARGRSPRVVTRRRDMAERPGEKSTADGAARGGAGASMSARGPAGRRSVAAGVALVLAGLGGYTTALAWDRPLVLPAPVTAVCRADDPRLLAADAAADAAATDADGESAVRGALRAFLEVNTNECAGRSRVAAVLAAAIDRLGSQRLGSHGSAVRGLAVAGDARVVALDEDGGVIVWDREGPGRPWPGVRAAQGIARSPDGRWLAVGGNDGEVRRWDLGDEHAAPQVYTHGAAPVTALSFAADGRLVSSDGAGELRVWRDGGEIAEFAAWPGVTTVQLAGDRLLAFGGGRAAVWQLGHARALALTTGANITAALLDADGTQVIVGDASGAVTRWQLGRRPRRETLTTHAAEVRAIAWVGDAVASVGADDALRIAELARRVRRDGPPLVLVADTPVPVDSLVVTDAGRRLVGVGRDGALVRWDLAQRNRRLPVTLLPGHRGPAIVAAADGWVVTGGADGVVRAWDMSEETDAAERPLVERACRALGWSEPGCEAP